VDRHEVERIIAGLANGSLNPMEQKKRLARTIVMELHGEEAAVEAEEHFERTVQRKETPDDIPEWSLDGAERLLDVVVAAGLAPSRREARRLFDQGAVQLDGAAAAYDAEVAPGQVVQVGKRRWLRLV
jgi:tyrosyl-tRNA synthetase